MPDSSNKTDDYSIVDLADLRNRAKELQEREIELVRLEKEELDGLVKKTAKKYQEMREDNLRALKDNELAIKNMIETGQALGDLEEIHKAQLSIRTSVQEGKSKIKKIQHEIFSEASNEIEGDELKVHEQIYEIQAQFNDIIDQAKLSLKKQNDILGEYSDHEKVAEAVGQIGTIENQCYIVWKKIKTALSKNREETRSKLSKLEKENTAVCDKAFDSQQKLLDEYSKECSASIIEEEKKKKQVEEEARLKKVEERFAIAKKQTEQNERKRQEEQKKKQELMEKRVSIAVAATELQKQVEQEKKKQHEDISQKISEITKEHKEESKKIVEEDSEYIEQYEKDKIEELLGALRIRQKALFSDNNQLVEEQQVKLDEIMRKHISEQKRVAGYEAELKELEEVIAEMKKQQELAKSFGKDGYSPEKLAKLDMLVEKAYKKRDQIIADNESATKNMKKEVSGSIKEVNDLFGKGQDVLLNHHKKEMVDFEKQLNEVATILEEKQEKLFELQKDEIQQMLATHHASDKKFEKEQQSILDQTQAKLKELEEKN